MHRDHDTAVGVHQQGFRSVESKLVQTSLVRFKHNSSSTQERGPGLQISFHKGSLASRDNNRMNDVHTRHSGNRGLHVFLRALQSNGPALILEMARRWSLKGTAPRCPAVQIPVPQLPEFFLMCRSSLDLAYHHSP